MTIIIIFLSVFLISLILIYFFILNLEKIINQVEKNIQFLLQRRTDLIPPIYEISKDYIVKHNQVFEEIIKLRKLQFSLNDYDVSFIEFIKNEMEINHEIKFIYGICNKNKKLIHNSKFNYIKNLIIQRNNEIWQEIENYKIKIKILNYMVNIKNYSIVWFLLPIRKRVEFDLIKNIF